LTDETGRPGAPVYEFPRERERSRPDRAGEARVIPFPLTPRAPAAEPPPDPPAPPSAA